MRIPDFTTERFAVQNWRPALDDPAARRRLETGLAGILTRPVLDPLPPALHLDGPGGIPAWVDARAAESEVLRVTDRATEALVGLMILAPGRDAENLPTLHIGYLLDEAAWGRGLASELVAGLVAALPGSGAIRLVGGVDTANPASARVLQKAGFTRAPDLSSGETDIYVRDIG